MGTKMDLLLEHAATSDAGAPVRRYVRSMLEVLFPVLILQKRIRLWVLSNHMKPLGLLTLLSNTSL